MINIDKTIDKAKENRERIEKERIKNDKGYGVFHKRRYALPNNKKG
jgi:hypothetical protein